jgi:serine/threonine protein kinase
MSCFSRVLGEDYVYGDHRHQYDYDKQQQQQHFLSDPDVEKISPKEWLQTYWPSVFYHFRKLPKETQQNFCLELQNQFALYATDRNSVLYLSVPHIKLHQILTLCGMFHKRKIIYSSSCHIYFNEDHLVKVDLIEDRAHMHHTLAEMTVGQQFASINQYQKVAIISQTQPLSAVAYQQRRHICDLGRYLYKYPITEQRCLRWITQLADGVLEMHHHQWLHRDLKLENVLITRAADAILSDFGLALRTLQEYAKPVLCYTWCYRPPELAIPLLNDQQDGWAWYDYSADIWALGILILNMLMVKPLAFRPGPHDNAQGMWYLLGVYSRLVGSPGLHDFDSFSTHCPQQVERCLQLQGKVNWNVDWRSNVTEYTCLPQIVFLLQHMLCWDPTQRWSIYEVCDYIHSLTETHTPVLTIPTEPHALQAPTSTLQKVCEVIDILAEEWLPISNMQGPDYDSSKLLAMDIYMKLPETTHFTQQHLVMGSILLALKMTHQWVSSTHICARGNMNPTLMQHVQLFILVSLDYLVFPNYLLHEPICEYMQRHTSDSTHIMESK